MKIGIIGNMNNSYFSLARYLRDEGLDCELLIFDNEPAHFDPSCDTFSTDYTTYCKHIAWGDPAHFLQQDFTVVEKDLAPYSFLIGNGPAPAYTAKIGRRLDIFIPYGYDIYSLPFLRLVHPKRLLAYAAVGRYQRKGIKESSYILFDRTNAAFEKVIKKLAYPGKRIISPAPMIYHKDYESGWQQAAKPDVTLQKLRQGADFLLVQHARQSWKTSGDYWAFKGNDLLIEGLARFVADHPAVNLKLVLFEYGADVEETKKLIDKCGIAAYVLWMPKMPRNQLMFVVAAADLIIGELHHSWLTYGVAIEALCLSKPLMHKRIDKEYAADYPQLYPMLHASSAASVYDGLKKLVQNKSSMDAMGDEGRQWFLTYCVERPLAIIKKIIHEKSVAVRA